MNYKRYEIALSAPRLGRYCFACKNDKNKALILYRYNIKLCQKFYGVLGVLEVVLRNAIDAHFRTHLADNNWIENQARTGFLGGSQEAILKEVDKLQKSGHYTSDRLVSSLSLGCWVFMFSRKCYRDSGKTLLQIFPRRAHGMNQSDIYRNLNSVREFRNRVAHHEPLCFDRLGNIDVSYAEKIYSMVNTYIHFLGYEPGELLFGVDSPTQTISRIDALGKAL